MNQRPVWPAALASLVLLAAPCPVGAQTHAKTKPPHPAAPTTPIPVLLIDGHGHGLLKQWDSHRDPTKGHVFLGVNVADGLAVLQTWLSTPAAPEVSADGYLEADSTHLLGRGALQANAVPGSKAPTMDLHAKWHQDAGQFGADGALDMSYASGQGRPVSAALLEGKATVAGYQTSDSQWHFTLTGDLVKSKIQAEFRSLDIKVSQADDLTTLTASLVLPPSSSLADTFKQMAANVADYQQKLTDQLKKQGFDVQTVTLSNARATDTEVGADLTVSVKFLGQTCGNLVKSVMQKVKSDSNTTPYEQGFGELSEVRVDNAELQVQAQGDTLDATLQGHVSNLDRMILGYLDLYQGFMTTVKSSLPKTTPQNKQANAVAEFILRGGSVSLQRARALMEAAATNSSDQQSYAFQVRYGNDGQSDSVHGTLDWHGDVQGLLQAAQTLHYPTSTLQSGQVSVQSDGLSFHSNVDFSVVGPWLDAIKMPYVGAAQETPGMEHITELLQSFGLADARLVVGLHHGKLSCDAYGQFTGLSPIMQATIRVFEPSFAAELTAFQVTADNPHGLKVFSQSRSYYSGLPEAVHAALLVLVKESEHAPKVQHATPADVAPPTLAKPDLSMPPSLQPTP